MGKIDEAVLDHLLSDKPTHWLVTVDGTSQHWVSALSAEEAEEFIRVQLHDVEVRAATPEESEEHFGV